MVVLGELSRVEALRDAIDCKLWCGADHTATTALLVTDKRLLEAVVAKSQWELAVFSRPSNKEAGMQLVHNYASVVECFFT